MGFRFAPTFFFPSIDLNDILEREFQISYTMGIPFDFNHKEYYEFVWFFERLVQERKRENDDVRRQEGHMSLKNLGSVNPAFGEIHKQMSGNNGRE